MEPKYGYGWTKHKSHLRKQSTYVEYAENVDPQTSQSFIWQTFLEIHHGLVLGIGVTTPGQKVLPSQIYILVGKINRLWKRLPKYWKPRMQPLIENTQVYLRTEVNILTLFPQQRKLCGLKCFFFVKHSLSSQKIDPKTINAFKIKNTISLLYFQEWL